MIFHHLGVACDDIAAEIPCFEALGYRCEGDIFRDPIQKVEGAFMTGPGPRLELLAPLDASSPVTPWMEKGVQILSPGIRGPFHGGSTGTHGRPARRVVEPPTPSVAFDGRSIAFVMLPGMILIELIQMEATT